MADKHGLESALDFTKFVITLDSGLMAFVTGTSFLADIRGAAERTVVAIILVLLGLSLIGGVFVYMRAATMFSDKNYDLNDRRLQIPGMINVIAFVLGAIAVGLLAVVNIVMVDDGSAGAGPAIELKIG